MTAAARDLPVTADSPGKPGAQEIWVDEATLNWVISNSALPLALIGSAVRFEPEPGRYVVYKIVCRRWSNANTGRPYYVLQWPD